MIQRDNTCCPVKSTTKAIAKAKDCCLSKQTDGERFVDNSHNLHVWHQIDCILVPELPAEADPERSSFISNI